MAFDLKRKTFRSRVRAPGTEIMSHPSHHERLRNPDFLEVLTHRIPVVSSEQDSGIADQSLANQDGGLIRRFERILGDRPCEIRLHRQSVGKGVQYRTHRAPL